MNKETRKNGQSEERDELIKSLLRTEKMERIFLWTIIITWVIALAMLFRDLI